MNVKLELAQVRHQVKTTEPSGSHRKHSRLSFVSDLNVTDTVNRPCYYNMCVSRAYLLRWWWKSPPLPLHVKHWRAVPLSLYGNLYYFQLWMETITERLLPDELQSACSHRHTHIHTPTDTQSNIRTHAESFTKDKRHPVGLRKRKREGGREGEGEKRSGSLLHFHSLPRSVCTEETSLLSLHSPVSTTCAVTGLVSQGSRYLQLKRKGVFCHCHVIQWFRLTFHLKGKCLRHVWASCCFPSSLGLSLETTETNKTGLFITPLWLTSFKFSPNIVEQQFAAVI